MPLSKVNPFKILRQRRRNLQERTNATSNKKPAAAAAAAAKDNRKSTKKVTSFLKRISTELTLKKSFYDPSSQSDLTVDLENSGPSHVDCTAKKQKEGPHEVLLLSTTSSTSISFQEQFSQIDIKKKESELRLVNFVETSTRHDIYSLRTLLDNKSMSWKRVTLQDTTTANALRRWRFKKDNIYHHIKDLCADRDIDLVWEGHVIMDVDEMPTVESVVGALSEVQKDYEIVRVELSGHLIDHHTELVLRQLTTLFGGNNACSREWQDVQIRLGYGGACPTEYLRWKGMMETYGMLLNQINWQFGIPIDIRIMPRTRQE